MKLLPYIEQELAGKFTGSIGWYYTTVKLDLEARGLLTHDLDAKPSVLVLT